LPVLTAGVRTIRQSTATHPRPAARTFIGFTSISPISGRSRRICDIRVMMATRAARSAGVWPRTPFMKGPIDRVAEKGAPVGADKVHPTRIAKLEEMVSDGATEVGRGWRDADNRHALRVEETAHRLCPLGGGSDRCAGIHGAGQAGDGIVNSRLPLVNVDDSGWSRRRAAGTPIGRAVVRKLLPLMWPALCTNLLLRPRI